MRLSRPYFFLAGFRGSGRHPVWAALIAAGDDNQVDAIEEGRSNKSANSRVADRGKP